MPNLNVELLDKVLDQIEKKPELWDQGNWIKSEYVKAEPQVINGEKVMVLPITCNTSFCYAGWTVFLEQPKALWTRGQQVVGTQEDVDWWAANGPEVDDDYLLSAPHVKGDVVIADPGAVAARLLGLTFDQAEALFHGDNDLKGIRRRVAQIKAGKQVDEGGDY